MLNNNPIWKGFTDRLTNKWTGGKAKNDNPRVALWVVNFKLKYLSSCLKVEIPFCDCDETDTVVFHETIVANIKREEHYQL